MSTPAKNYYKNYLADDNLSELNHRLAAEVMTYLPNHVLSFGEGTGKNLKLIEKIQENYGRNNVVTVGLDVSIVNVLHAKIKNGLEYYIHGDEGILRNLVNFDVVFTVSVLDHIEDIDGIIQEFKRIANKAVIIAETNDTPGEFYYIHDYESYGFKKVDFEWTSHKPEGDGATYGIWIYDKLRREPNFPPGEYGNSFIDSNDDLGTAKPPRHV